MRKFGLGAAILLATTCMGHAADASQGYGQACRNLLHYYPTPAPLAVKVGQRVLVTCQAEQSAHYQTIMLTFNVIDDVKWWSTHHPDRVIVPGEGPND